MTVLSILFLVFVFFMLPGLLLLSNVHYTRKTPYEVIPLSIALSLSLWLIPVLFAFYFRVEMYSFVVFVILLIGAALVFNLRRLKINRSSLKRKWLTVISYSKEPFVLFLISISILCLLYGSCFKWDAINHVAAIRKLAEGMVINSDYYFYKDVGMDPGYPFNEIYLLFALISRISGLDILIVWDVLPFVIYPMILLSIYFLAVELFDDKVAKISVIVMVCLDSLQGFFGAGIFMPSIFAYPSLIARLMCTPLLLGLVLRYVRSNSRLYLFIALPFSAALCSIHIWYFLSIYISLGSVILFMMYGRKQYSSYIKRGAFFLLLMTLISLPLMYIRTKAYGFAMAAHPPIPESLLWHFSDDIFVFNFFSDVLALRFHFLGVIVLFPVWLFITKNSESYKISRIFIASNIILPVLVLLVPYLNSFMIEMLGWGKARRFAEVPILPLVLIYASLIKIAIEKYRHLFKMKILVPCCSLMLITLIVPVFVYRMPSLKKVGYAITGEHEASGVIRQLKNILHDRIKLEDREEMTFLKNNVPSRSVVLANMELSNIIPVYANQYVVAVPTEEFPPIMDNQTRIDDVNLFLSSATDIGEKIEIINKYGVEWLLLSDNETTRLEPFLQAYNQNVKKMFSTNNFSIYKCTLPLKS